MLNQAFYIFLATVYAKTLLYTYIPGSSQSMTLYVLQTLILTLWVAPLIWKQGYKELNALYLQYPIGFWILPLAGCFLVSLGFLPLFQQLAVDSLGGALLTMGISLLGGALFWGPLLSSRLSLPQQCIYIFILTLLHFPLMLYLSNTPSAIYNFGGVVWPPLILNALEEQYLAAMLYQTGWLMQLLVLGSQLFWQWGKQSADQDQKQNQTYFENYYLVQKSPRRLG